MCAFFIMVIFLFCIKLAGKHQPFLFPIMISLFLWSCRERDRLRERDRRREGGLDVLPQRRAGEKIHESCCFRISFCMFQWRSVCEREISNTHIHIKVQWDKHRRWVGSCCCVAREFVANVLAVRLRSGFTHT